MTGDQPRGKPRRKPPPPITEQRLAELALRYLDRFDSSVVNLRRVLERSARRAAAAHPTDLAQVSVWIEALLERYVASGLLNEARYAENRVQSLRARGKSKRAIVQKLKAKGVDSDDIERALEERSDSGDSELAAARRYAERRRLARAVGPSASPEQRRRALAALARAGFDYDTAQRALALTIEAESDASNDDTSL